MKEATLPSGWKLEVLGNLSSAIQYGYTAKAQAEPVGPRLLRITDIQNDTVKWDQVPFCKIQKEDKPKYLLAPNDILFARTGATVGKSYLIRDQVPDSVFASYLIRVRLTNEVTPKYVAYFFKSADYWRQITENQAGIGQPNVNGTKLAQIEIPVAPANQQHSIVAEIEKQFSRLDEAVANLRRVIANLKRYKAAVLKAAVEGKLVSTKRPWKQAELGQIATSIRNGYSKKPDAQLGTRIFRISAVRPMELDTNDVRYLSGTPASYEPFLVGPGDVLFTRYNGSRDYVGVCARVPATLPPTVYPDKLIRVRVPDSILLPEFLVILSSTGRARQYVESRIRTTAGQSGISGGDLKSLPLDIPGVEEQQRIVAEVERRLSVIEELEATVEANLTRADRLRQSILQRAFSDRLLS